MSGVDRQPKAGKRIRGPRSDRRKFSEATLALELMGPFIKDSILLSAYDLHHRHFRSPCEFFADKEVIFIDSGGYELGPGFDATEPVHLLSPSKRFSVDDYVRVLMRLSKELPFVIANYDWGTRRQPIVRQVSAAQRLFSRFPGFLKDFIVKPGEGRYVTIEELVRHIGKLRAFDIVGLTEKDLGKNLVDRLVAVARLRLAMDQEGLAVPIHIWGGLDPLCTPLYFFAGAEIFDGVSWLRYAYVDGVAMYRDSYTVVQGGIEIPTDHARALALSHNLEYLRILTTRLRDFVLQGGRTFEMFGRQASAMEVAFRCIATHVPSVSGGE